MQKYSDRGYLRFDSADIQDSLWTLIAKCPGDKKEKENPLKGLLLAQYNKIIKTSLVVSSSHIFENLNFQMNEERQITFAITLPNKYRVPTIS